MHIIDLRSDTVTHPTEEMRTAMASAEVGDDVFSEDPTINRLQEIATEKMGMEAGLFVSSGTMGNLLAVLSICSRGDEVIMGDLGHTFLFEGGGISALGGVFPHILHNQPDGSIALDDIRKAIRPDDIHHPVSRMVILENTHNRCGGVVLSTEYTTAVSELAREKQLHLHMDGARIFNAAAYLEKSAQELVNGAQSVTFCLSKGLCAPVGSVLCGSRDFITRARRLRKMLGGGMRQAGILAAAGIVAVEKMAKRLGEDHARATRLAEGLALIAGIRFEMGMPQTNMVFPTLPVADRDGTVSVVKKLVERGVKAGIVGDKSLRLVTHYWVTDEDVAYTIDCFRDVLGG